jgi:hypothetical protein
MTPAARALRIAPLPLLWLTTVILMVRSWAGDPYDPALEGTDRYGHNHDGALTDGVVFTVIELAVLLAILRPWSYDRSWGRSLVATMLLLPVTAFSMLMSMHAGGIIALHFTWLFLALVGVAIAFLVSAISKYRGITGAHPHAAMRSSQSSVGSTSTSHR